MDTYFFKSIIAGLLLGIPAGPLGAIAIRKMITKGSLHGAFFCLGCALVDIIYVSITGLGVNFISDFIILNQMLIRLLGGLFLIVVGIKVFFTNPFPSSNTANDERKYLGSFVFSFILALTSPATLLSFTVVFASLNLGFTSMKSLIALQSIIGVVIGGAVWWVILCFSIRYMTRKIELKSLKYINKFFGILIIGFAVLIYVYN
ncbi:MAG: LysE family transporter [Clostridia bacterium]|nr:LysE family transporter [Clostridia bacterium]